MSWRNSFLLFLSFVLAISVLRWKAPPLKEAFPSSVAVRDFKQNLLRLTLSSDEKYRLFVPLKEISPLIIQAALRKEDRYFYWHLGINPLSIARAIARTYSGRRMGGSTITMQLARKLYHLQTNRPLGKLQQMLYALLLEVRYSKKEILEAYLNTAPFGGNIEGVAAACMINFHRRPINVTLPEATLLMEIPQNPNKKSFLKNPHQLMPKNLTHLGQLTITGYPISQMPFLAPHFVEKVLREKRFDQSEVVTTLDLSLQQILELELQTSITSLSALGIRNASLLLVHAPTMEVKAMVGSANYYDSEIEGAVNGVEAKRSPGSALKPFVYALALDEGLIHSKTLLKDVPTSFSNFDPENFDRTFMGPIDATKALTLSRNIPAVQLNSQLKKKRLYQFLEESNVSKLKSEEFYGLGLALGGAEVTMEEVAAMYGVIANQGLFQPLKIFSDQVFKSKRLLSKEASIIVQDMLTENSLAWKTGTSHGLRDAWTAGIFGPYILVVWVGNFDGSSNPNLIGREVAAPIFFKIAHRLGGGGRVKDPGTFLTSTANVKKVKVCAVSGHLPGPYCKHTVEAEFIPGVSPIQTCNVHRLVRIDKSTGLRLCTNQETKNVVEEIYEFWPNDVFNLFQKANLARKRPPPFLKSCAENSFNHNHAPQITSPKSDQTYILRFKKGTENGNGDNESLALSAVSDGEVRKLHWFVNEEYLGAVSSDKSLIWPMRAGSFSVRVVDDQGGADQRELKVIVVQ